MVPQRMKKRNCVVCGKEITKDDLDIVFDIFPGYFVQADALGMESLTENQQLLVEGKICSEDCFYNLG